MILSATFFCLGTMSFFCLRLDRFIQFFVYFFGHIRLGIRAFEFLSDSQRGFAPFVGPGESYSVRFQSFVSEFLGSARDLCHGKQWVSPFYHDSLTTTTKRTTSFLLQITLGIWFHTRDHDGNCMSPLSKNSILLPSYPRWVLSPF